MGSSNSKAIQYDPNYKQSVAVGGGDWGKDPHRNVNAPEKLIGIVDPYNATLYDNFRTAVSKYGSNKCLGTRVVNQDGTRGPYGFITYKTVIDKATVIGSAVKHLGIERGAKIGICSVNRTEWVVCEQACNAYAMPTVALYDTLGPSAIKFILSHAEVPLAFLSKDKLGQLYSAVKDGEVPSLKHIVSFEESSSEEIGKFEACGIKLYSMKEFLEIGNEHPAAHDPPKPEDLAIVMYTSGTTGDPKGVMITHENMMSTVNSVVRLGLDIEDSDVHFSFLPLAHCFERAIQATIFGSGASIGFFQGIIPKLPEDILELKPTLFAGVPRIFNRFYDKINGTVEAAGGLKLSLFKKAYEARRVAFAKGEKAPFWTNFIFDKIKSKLGGRIRFMLTGSAPIDPKVLEFLRICFCPYVLQGYGLTETCAASAVTNYWDNQLGRVGPPLVCNEYKLVDVPDMNYFTTDAKPRGELCIRGKNVFKGYYKNPEKTKEDIDEDGWFHTGDVGQWNDDGTMSIIDRKKNIFKLAQGEYVAAEYLETVYGKSMFVGQVFVYGDSMKSFLVAVVVPDEDAMKEFCKKNERQFNMEALCADKEIEKMILTDMTAVGKQEKLRGFEFVKGIVVDHTPFSTENDLLTPTFKLKRPNAKKYYKEKLDSKYAELEK